MLRRFIFAALLVLTGAAQAQTVGLHIGSVHSRAGFNDVNPGLYVRTESGAVAGVFRNSVNRTSVYAGFAIDAGRYSLMAGLATGYEKHAEPMTCNNAGSTGCWHIVGSTNARLVPMVVPSMRLPDIAGVTPRISFVPGFGVNANALHLSIEKQL